MLTDLFYYNHYRPYIIKQKATDSPKKLVQKPVVPENDVKDFSVSMNKALKRDVVTFAKDVYYNVTNLKNSSVGVIKNIDKYNNESNKPEFDEEEFDEDLTKSLEYFSTSFNKALGFSSKQTHSPQLTGLGYRLKDTLDENREAMGKLGLSEQENGELVFDKNKLNEALGKYKESASQALNSGGSFFNNINHEAKDTLSAPMSEHMNFKGFTYYYNYKYDAVQQKTYQLTDSGMLLDLVL